MGKIMSLFIGGTIGTFARYFLSTYIHSVVGVGFPYGTFVVNIIGCFIIGFIAAFADNKILFDSNLRLLLMVGFCGAFTTFSSFIFETSGLLREGESVKAFLNIISSVTVGFIVFRIGAVLGKLI
ncbi:MAG TPA: fluoride efflux transporter CrcB [Candidatus Omnitrophota bacterium]|nr:fluoride efflux transporter CrcB [Candidatus Omnitrophota bacterium]